MIKTGIIYLGDQLLYTQRNPHFSCPISDFDQSCQYIYTIQYLKDPKFLGSSLGQFDVAYWGPLDAILKAAFLMF